MSENNTIDELIIHYLQQEIGESELRTLEVWLEESVENKRYFFQLKNISDSVRQNEHYKNIAVEKSWERMSAKLECIPTETSRPKRKIFNLQVLKYAAIVLIALTTGWGIGTFRTNNTSLFVSSAIYNEIQVEKGGKANTLLLADGSKVILNAATTFRYPTNFGGKNREVFLDGEAYFEVAKDAKMPFIVHLKNQAITVLGTSFNIEAYSNEPYSVTTLLSGSVFLETFNDAGETINKMRMMPNQKALSNNQTGAVSLLKVDASLSNTWTYGTFKFKDEPLCAIVRRLENYYGINIWLNDDSLKQIRYTGTFSLDQNIQEILQVINYEKQFSFKRVGKEIVITKTKNIKH